MTMVPEGTGFRKTVAKIVIVIAVIVSLIALGLFLIGGTVEITKMGWVVIALAVAVLVVWRI